MRYDFKIRLSPRRRGVIAVHESRDISAEAADQLDALLERYGLSSAAWIREVDTRREWILVFPTNIVDIDEEGHA